MQLKIKHKLHREWEDWFAWHPVKIRNDSVLLSKTTPPENHETVTWIWLEKICRRKVNSMGKKEWRYATLFDLIEMEAERNKQYGDSNSTAGYAINATHITQSSGQSGL